MASRAERRHRTECIVAKRMRDVERTVRTWGTRPAWSRRIAPAPWLAHARKRAKYEHPFVGPCKCERCRAWRVRPRETGLDGWDGPEREPINLGFVENWLCERFLEWPPETAWAWEERELEAKFVGAWRQFLERRRTSRGRTR